MKKEKKGGTGLILRLMWQQRFTLLLILACLLVFALVTLVYQAPLEGVLYALLLCLALVILSVAFTLYNQVGHHKALSQARAGLPESLRLLPEPQSQAERDCQALLFDMDRMLSQRITRDDQRYAQLSQYYTLWSHQIKTPLAAMKLLLERQDSEDSRAMKGEVFKVSQYVDMALNYLRLEGPDSDFVFQDLKVKELASAAARRHALPFVQKKLGLTLEIPETATVKSDAKWLGFVLDQLLSNAVKYTQKGGVTLSYVESERALRICDTGMGIAPEDVPRVFEHGFTGYTGRLSEQATGIGLYLSQQIAKRLGHRLSLSSTPGEGTCVVLQFMEHPQEIE